jgi:hypothetical protein
LLTRLQAIVKGAKIVKGVVKDAEKNKLDGKFSDLSGTNKMNAIGKQAIKVGKQIKSGLDKAQSAKDKYDKVQQNVQNMVKISL